MSSVDPSAETIAVKARLDALGETCLMGVPQGYEFVRDQWGNKAPYRDLEPGSVVPRNAERMLGVHEQSQPYLWAFQIHHVASTRSLAVALATESDRSLVGWIPSANAAPVRPYYFTVYDDFDEAGERLQWIASRFYEVMLGQETDLS